MGKLYETVAATNAKRQELQNEVNRLKEEITSLQTKVSRLQILAEQDVDLLRVIDELKAQVDRLMAYTGLSPLTKPKKKPAQKS